MRAWVILFTAGLIALAGPVGTQSWANDAHHPEKGAKAQESGKARPKQPQKKPAGKSNKSKQTELRFPRV